MQRYKTQTLPIFIRNHLFIATPNRCLLLLPLTRQLTIPKHVTLLPYFPSTSSFHLHLHILGHPNSITIRSMFSTSKNSIRYLLSLTTTKMQQLFFFRRQQLSSLVEYGIVNNGTAYMNSVRYIFFHINNNIPSSLTYLVPQTR